MKPEELARYIDHTLLRPQATREDVLRACEEAKRAGFASVCVSPCHAAAAAEALAGSGVVACCVVGFPSGAHTPAAKAFEARDAVQNGAGELDMVINIGAVKAKDWDWVRRDIQGVVDAARGKAQVKVILEACLLTDEEKERACLAAQAAGADFVKTSTGFSSGGATEADVRLMRKTVGDGMGVKASGGIGTYEDAVRMIKAGASRLGASAGLRIIRGPAGQRDAEDGGDY